MLWREGKFIVSKLLSSLDPLPRTTLSEQVAKQMASRIIAGDWKPGEKLPSEAELCSALGVGRSSLREALTSLAFIGLIRVRAGGGSYVADQPSAYFTSPWLAGGTLNSEQALEDFMEARLILESETAAICAERVTDTELEQLADLVEKMRASFGNPDEFWKHDYSFHLVMGGASKNKVLTSILNGVREQMRDLISKSLLLDEGMTLAARQHAKILETLRAHNPNKAREAMRNHLQSFQRGYKVIFANRQK
jgi:GntR family transcriptional repressor for pyruvate dehydrogenase complex